MSFGLDSNQVSAATNLSMTASNESASQLSAMSKYAEYSTIGRGLASDRYYYEDSYGYKGYIPLLGSYPYPGGRFQAYYGGTVYCSGVCPGS